MGDWRDIDEEEGERVPSNRLERMLKLGSMSARVGISSLSSKLRSFLWRGDPEEREERLRRAFAENAELIAEVLGELKGASLKVGQLLSADPDVLPEGFAEVLASLQRDAPPMDYDTVVAQIERGLDREIASVFSYFDPEPIGAASIGQVHAATLDDGRQVAVKVQYPGVVDALESDLRTLRQMLVFGRVAIDRERLDAYFEEVRGFVLDEADYLQEAEQMREVGAVLAELPGIEVPEPIERWCAETVLVMERVEGEKLDEALLERPAEERRAVARRWVEMYLHSFQEHQVLHADPHPGNFLLDGDILRVLDFGCVGRFDAAFTDGMLAILVACWEDDIERVVELYDEHGFSTERASVHEIDRDLLREYHAIILAPFLEEGAFDFGSWNPTMRAKRFILRHPSFLALVPPRDALLYFRTLAGIRGLLRKVDVAIDVRAMAEEIARRRGLL